MAGVAEVFRRFIFNDHTRAEDIPRDLTHVSFDASITVVPSAFDDLQCIKELYCHEGVYRIEVAAFETSSIERAIMPGVEILEVGVFSHCEDLKYVDCDKLKIIKDCAFECCPSIHSINLPSAEVVGEGAFADLHSMTDAKFGNKLISFGDRAFLNCKSMEHITIPLKNGLIPHDNTFRLCSKLNRVDLVDGAILKKTTNALLMEEWKNDMYNEIDSINQILPNTFAGVWENPDDAGGKALAIRMWIAHVLHKIIYYKEKHSQVLKETAATLQSSLPHDIVQKNVLPFLELPAYTFDGEDSQG